MSEPSKIEKSFQVSQREKEKWKKNALVLEEKCEKMALERRKMEKRSIEFHKEFFSNELSA